MTKMIAWDLFYISFIGLGLAVMKLTRFVDLPWLWILSPFWLFGVILLLIFLAGVVVGAWGEMRRDK